MTDAPPPTVQGSLRSFAYAPAGPAGAEDEPVDIAEDFHEAAKIPPDFPGRSLGPGGRWLATTPGSHLELGRKALACRGQAYPLPAPVEVPGTVASAIRDRRSGLPADGRPITAAELSTVLALSAGCAPGHPERRVSPSGGGMYPLDVVAIVRAVEGLTPGAYL